ncbi:hypothetical protein SETIT_6G030100v2 [Setaria italica]|uniref:Uncharacterized protein n=1 Tax=Setaria italica TaxID=4555 RepID=A0A368RHX7_SETIT|nr:hypothetical protein SETIT_6G030100v2 [Setaria italica]
MDKALASGAGDCGFESHRGRFFIFVFHLFLVPPISFHMGPSSRPNAASSLDLAAYALLPRALWTLGHLRASFKPSAPTIRTTAAATFHGPSLRLFRCRRRVRNRDVPTTLALLTTGALKWCPHKVLLISAPDNMSR